MAETGVSKSTRHPPLDALCPACQAMFQDPALVKALVHGGDQDAVSRSSSRPRFPHLLCTEVRASAETCHICFLLAEDFELDDETESGASMYLFETQDKPKRSLKKEGRMYFCPDAFMKPANLSVTIHFDDDMDCQSRTKAFPINQIVGSPVKCAWNIFADCTF